MTPHEELKKNIEVLKDLRNIIDQDKSGNRLRTINYFIAIGERLQEEDMLIELIKSDDLTDCVKYEPNKYKYRLRLTHAILTYLTEEK